MKVFIFILFLIAGILAANESGETKKADGIKAKRAYTLGYGYSAPITYDHDFIAHAPIVHHTPLTAAAIAHPVIPAIHAPLISPIAKTSVVSTSVHHLPTGSYFTAAHAPIISSAAYVAHHPAAATIVEHHHPLITEFHRR